MQYQAGNILITLEENDNDKNTCVNAASCVVVVESILMDFGSAGPLTVTLDTQHNILSAIELTSQQTIELTSQQTTLSYQPSKL